MGQARGVSIALLGIVLSGVAAADAVQRAQEVLRPPQAPGRALPADARVDGDCPLTDPRCRGEGRPTHPGLGPYPPQPLRDLNAPDQPLHGIVDMHTHPMSHLAFGSKLFHGAPDVGSLMPDRSVHCSWLEGPATAEWEALPDCMAVHGGYDLFSNGCGNQIRHELIKQLESASNAQSFHSPFTGVPNLSSWPSYDDITHQMMWVDWIERSYNYGVRVIVALAHQSETFAKAVDGAFHTDDRGSAEVQIEQMKAFAGRHDFMEVALTPSELREIVEDDRLAVVLGIELDDLMNRDEDPAADVATVLTEYHELGVRYVFPIHLTDNLFGGTAIYSNAFETANKYQTGDWWIVGCAPRSDVSHRVGAADPFEASFMTALQSILLEDWFDVLDAPPTPPVCAYGHVNARGLSAAGRQGILEMMRLGMLLDVDHMSERAADSALEMADKLDYPMSSGHSGPRSFTPKESSRTPEQYQIIGRVGGLAGIGWADTDAQGYLNQLVSIPAEIAVALGTDANSLVTRPAPPEPDAAPSGYRWDYRRQGVAHYGLIPEFLSDVRSKAGGKPQVERLFQSAEAFADMWEKAVAASAHIPNGWSDRLCSRSSQCDQGSACVDRLCEDLLTCSRDAHCPRGYRCTTEGAGSSQPCFSGALGCACTLPETTPPAVPSPRQLYDDRLGTACEATSECSADGVPLWCSNAGVCRPFPDTCSTTKMCPMGWICGGRPSDAPDTVLPCAAYRNREDAIGFCRCEIPGDAQ